MSYVDFEALLRGGSALDRLNDSLERLRETHPCPDANFIGAIDRRRQQQSDLLGRRVGLGSVSSFTIYNARPSGSVGLLSDL